MAIKKAKRVDIENGFRFEFTDGSYTQCDITKLNPEIKDQLALHGLKQKIADSFAGEKDALQAHIAAEATWKNLVAGVWATKAMRGGKIIEAIVRVFGITHEAALEKWSNLTDDMRKVVRNDAKIKKALADIEAERAAALADAAEDADTSTLDDMFK